MLLTKRIFLNTAQRAYMYNISNIISTIYNNLTIKFHVARHLSELAFEPLLHCHSVLIVADLSAFSPVKVLRGAEGLLEMCLSRLVNLSIVLRALSRAPACTHALFFHLEIARPNTCARRVQRYESDRYTYFRLLLI
jgi:hypothetical protein